MSPASRCSRFFWTVITVWGLAYVFTVTGTLLSLTAEMLTLLGIAGTGSVLARLIASRRAMVTSPPAYLSPPGSPPEFWDLAVLVPVCLIASLMNPYGYRLLTFPFELAGMQFFMQMIHEWKPPYHSVYNSTTMFFFYLLHISMLCATFFTVQRDRAQRGKSPLDVTNQVIVVMLTLTDLALAYVWFQWLPVSWNSPAFAIILYAMFGLFVLFSVVNLRSVDFTQAGICCLFFLLSLRHNRGVTDAALGTFPILATAASAMLEQRERERKMEAPLQIYARRPDRSTRAAVILGSFLLLGIAAHTLVFSYYYDFTGARRQKGFGITDNMPTCAVDFIVRHELSGQAFVSYPYAALLIYRMSPAVKVNMDSRNDVYGEELFREYLDALGSAEGMRGYLERHRIDFFLMAYGDRASTVFHELQFTGEWVAVHYDDRTFILVKRTDETKDLIRHEGFRVIKPPVEDEINVDTMNAAQILEEAERAIRNCPTSLFAHRYKEKALLSLQEHEKMMADSQDPQHLE